MTFNLNEIIRALSRRPLTGICWGLFALSVILFFAVMPRYVDDFWYAQGLRSWILGLPAHGHSLLQAITQTWAFHYLNDNARLPNIIIVPLLLLPKWIGSIPAALALSYSFIKGSFLAPRRPSLLSAAIAMLLFAFCLPWYDCMGSEDLQLNYAPAAWLAVWVATLFLHSPAPRPRNLAALTILGFIFGAWHEGFSTPIFIACATIFLTNPSLRTRSNLWLLAGMLAGIAYLLACPAIYSRIPDGQSPLSPSHLLFIAACHPALLLALAVSIIAALRRNLRNLAADPLTLLLIISAATSIGIHIFAARTPRTGFWAEMASILLIIRLLPLRSIRKNLRICLITLCLTLTFIHQSLTVVYSFIINAQFSRLTTLYSRPRPQPLFAPLITEHDAPLLAWFSPDFTLFTGRVNRRLVEEFYHPHDNNEFIVIPDALSHVTPRAGRPIPGNLNARMLRGHIFLPLTDSIARDFALRDQSSPEYSGLQPIPATAANLRSGEISASIKFGPITKPHTRLFFLPFISRADGRPYLYLYPWRAIIERRLSPPTEISLKPKSPPATTK